jgi:hypothetical protein
MTQSYNLSQLANNLNTSGQLLAASGLSGATPIANGGTGATTAIDARINLDVAQAVYAVPSGGIIMWSGSIASIPTGWFLCNGSNSTPDLRNKFIIGASIDNGGVANTTVTGSNTQSGGSKDSVVVSHTHVFTGTALPTHTHNYNDTGVYPGGSGSDTSAVVTGQAANRATTASSAGTPAGTNAVPVGAVAALNNNANLPPYYALAFIMKS